MASHQRPNVIVLAGPNGSGKSTIAPALLKGTLGLTEFVNADLIAQGLSGFDPLGAALEAGRIMHRRLRELAAARATFAFETTLASKSLRPWLAELIQGEYRFCLVFLWLPSADAAVQRVADRTAMGGHFVPEETVRRRYEAGLRNFFRIYHPLTETWAMCDNSGESPELIAAGKGVAVLDIAEPAKWNSIVKGFRQ